MVRRILLALGLVLTLAAPPALAQVRIPDLPKMRSPQPTDLSACVQGGQTMGCTSQQIVQGGRGVAVMHGPPVKLVGPDGLHAAPGLYVSDEDMFASCPFQAGVGAYGCGGPNDTIAGNEHKQLLFTGSTTLGATSEWPFTIDYMIDTGAAPPWAPGATYAAGSLVTTPGGIYTAIVGGVSAGGGAGPSGTGQSIADGQVVWEFNCTGGCNDKLVFNISSVAGPHAGPSWAFSVNHIVAAGNNTGFSNAIESDYSNDSGTDCTSLTTQHCVNVWLYGGGSNEGTSALIIDTAATAAAAYVYPLWLPYDRGNLCGVACVEIDAPGPVGLEFGGDNYGTRHAIATLRDNSHSNDFLDANGVYDNAILNLSQAGVGSTPLAVQLRGNQWICKNSGLQCEYYDAAGDNQLHDTNNSGVTVRELDNVGNETLGGSLTTGSNGFVKSGYGQFALQLSAGGYRIDPLQATSVIGGGVTLANGAATQAGIGVPGAVAGDLVVCSASVDLQGLVLTGYVASADQTKCNYSNATGATVTLGAHTLTVRDLRQ